MSRNDFKKGQIYLIALTAEEKAAMFAALVFLYNDMAGSSPDFSSRFYQNFYTNDGRFPPMDIADLRKLALKFRDFESLDDIYDDKDKKE